MKLYVKQEVLTLREKFFVKNESGENVYYVEGSFFSIPKVFEVQDMGGQVLVKIEREIFSIIPRYNITIGDTKYTLRRELSLFGQRYSIKENEWRVTGDFFAHEYSIKKDRCTVMSMSKHWFTWGDSYELNIESNEDALLCLAIVIAIDEQLLQDNN